MKKVLHPMLLFLAISAFGQKVDFIARGNISIGAEYERLEFDGRQLPYSPGGGMGAELGVQIELIENLSLQSTLGYQLHAAFVSESFNGASNESFFTFNRKFLSVGAIKRLPLREDLFNSFILGAGFHYNSPGALDRTENNTDLGTSRYRSNLGFYADLSLRLKMSDKVFIDPGIRIRRLNFNGVSYTQGSINDLPTHLQSLNANGVELALSLIKTI